MLVECKIIILTFPLSAPAAIDASSEGITSYAARSSCCVIFSVILGLPMRKARNAVSSRGNFLEILRFASVITSGEITISISPRIAKAKTTPAPPDGEFKPESNAEVSKNILEMFLESFIPHLLTDFTRFLKDILFLVETRNLFSYLAV